MSVAFALTPPLHPSTVQANIVWIELYMKDFMTNMSGLIVQSQRHPLWSGDQVGVESFEPRTRPHACVYSFPNQQKLQFEPKFTTRRHDLRKLYKRRRQLSLCNAHLDFEFNPNTKIPNGISVQSTRPYHLIKPTCASHPSSPRSPWLAQPFPRSPLPNACNTRARVPPQRSLAALARLMLSPRKAAAIHVCS